MNGKLLGGQPQMQIAAPMNDTQLVAMIAVELWSGRSPAEAVEEAMEIVAESIVQMRGNALAAKVQEIVRRHEASQP